MILIKNNFMSLKNEFTLKEFEEIIKADKQLSGMKDNIIQCFSDIDNINLTILTQKLFNSNFDEYINEKIITLMLLHFSIPKPKFKKKDKCIRTYDNGKKQYVTIYRCLLDDYQEDRGYLYEYEYYPSSEGYGTEKNLRLLTDEEKVKKWFQLPNDMEAEPMKW